MTPMSASKKEPSVEEVAHVNLRTALDEFEKVTIDAFRRDDISSFYYSIYIFLAMETNKIANYIIDSIAEKRGGKL